MHFTGVKYLNRIKNLHDTTLFRRTCGVFEGDGLIIYRRLLRKLLTVEFKADDVERIMMLYNSK
jgi:hypothetical protein